MLTTSVGNSPVPGEFPAQSANNAENASIWWRHHEMGRLDFNAGITNDTWILNTVTKCKK